MKRRIQQGFTLIELMVVVAIIGILAAIAVPVYEGYAVRSKMSEAVATLAACKTAVQEYASTKAAWPADVDVAACSTTATQYLASMSVASTGAITATATNTGIADCNLVLTPQGSATSISGWTGSTSCATKYVPANFR